MDTPSDELEVYQELHRAIDRDRRHIKAKLLRIQKRLDTIEKNLGKLSMPPASNQYRASKTAGNPFRRPPDHLAAYQGLGACRNERQNRA